jgi:hypothetical protein
MMQRRAVAKQENGVYRAVPAASSLLQSITCA